MSNDPDNVDFNSPGTFRKAFEPFGIVPPDDRIVIDLPFPIYLGEAQPETVMVIWGRGLISFGAPTAAQIAFMASPATSADPFGFPGDFIALDFRASAQRALAVQYGFADLELGGDDVGRDAPTLFVDIGPYGLRFDSSGFTSVPPAFTLFTGTRLINTEDGRFAYRLDGGERSLDLTGNPVIDLTYRADFADVPTSATGSPIVGTAAGDQLLASGRAFGGGGNETVAGLAGNDTIEGGSGKDVLFGDAGADLLRGDFGDDVLIGGLGADTLNGGADVDLFTYMSASESSVAAGIDVIEDFESGTDRIVFNGEVNGYALAVEGDFHVLRLQTASGTFELRSVNAIGLADLDLVLTHRGTGANEIFSGLSFGDVLRGGGGADTLTGGDGADVFVYAAASDSTAAAADLITDFSSFNDRIDLRALPATSYSIFQVGSEWRLSVVTNAGTLLVRSANEIRGENLVFGSSLTLNGGLNSDLLVGGALGDQLFGGGANDTLFGRGGDDELDGGAGNDRLNGGGSDGPSGSDRLSGGAGLDELFGGDGNDVLNGGEDADFINGGGGDDLIEADPGNDSISGGAGFDTLRFSGSAAATVNLSTRTATSASSGTDTLDSIEEVIGGSGDDRLTGDLISGRADFEEGSDFFGPYFLDGLFDLDSDPRIMMDQSIPHATVVADNATFITMPTGIANYQFTVHVPGSLAIFDVDGASFDTLIEILDSEDRVIASNDNGAVVDADSIATDSLLTFRFADAGLYFVRITAAGTGALPNPYSFTLHISLENALPGATLRGGGGSDILTGQNTDDQLFGDAGNDELSAGVGRDLLDGGAGADLMRGGAGDDSYVVDQLGDQVIEAAGDGLDEVRTALGAQSAPYRLPDHVERLTGLSNTAQAVRGNALDNLITMSSGADFVDLRDGGDDVAVGGAGDDGFYFGAALNAADEVDGGGGVDQVGLQGNYASLTLGPKTLIGVEQLALLPGNDARFGDTLGALYSYDLTTVDANVAAGQQLVVTFNTLRAGENVTFNGAAETDGFFLTFGGFGTDNLTGGQKDDGFFFGTGGRFGASDKVDGQGGAFDQLGLQGLYTGANAITFGADQLKGIEFIVALTGGDARFGSGGAGYSYDLTTSDGNVVAGATLVVSANTLRSDETLTFAGAAETNGAFRIFSGAGADTITGGAGADEISGGRGADLLQGGAGADTFLYSAAADSTSTSFDRIVNFDYRVDKIDLPTAVGNFSAAITGTLSLATFDADLAAALAGVLGPGEAAAFQASGGDMVGRTFGIVDANGVAGYQPGEDYVVEFVTPVTPPDPTIDFLI